jgi:hypothetical protein
MSQKKAKAHVATIKTQAKIDLLSTGLFKYQSFIILFSFFFLPFSNQITKNKIDTTVKTLKKKKIKSNKQNKTKQTK